MEINFLPTEELIKCRKGNVQSFYSRAKISENILDKKTVQTVCLFLYLFTCGH